MEITEQELAFLERNTPGAAAIYRWNGKQVETLYVSEELPRLNGMTMEEYLQHSGRDAASFIIEEDVPKLMQAVRTCIETRKPIDCFYRVFHKKLGIDWAHMNAKICGEIDGAPVFLAVYANASVETDIYQNILDHTDRKVLVRDCSTHEVLFANKSAKKCGAVEGANYIGMKCYELLFGKKEECTDCIMKTEGCGSCAVTRYDPSQKKWERLSGSFIRWCGHDAYVHFIDDITDLVQQQNALKNVVEAAQTQLDATQLLNASCAEEECMPEILRRMGEFFKADRTYIIRINPDGRTLTNTFEWCREGVEPEIEKLQKVDIHYMDYWMPFFKKQEIVTVSDIEEIRAARPDEYEIMSMQGIRSYMEAPIMIREHLAGFIGVDNPAEDKLAHAGEMLLAFAYTLGGAYQRLHAEMQLKIHAEELENIVNNVPFGLSVTKIRDGKVISRIVNPLLCELYGIPFSESASAEEYAVGHISEQDRTVLAEKQKSLSVPGTAFRQIYRYRYKDETELRWYQISARSVLYGDELFYLACIIDITAEKVAENESVEYQRLLQDAINYSDVQYFTYFPERRRLDLPLLNVHYRNLPVIFENFPESFISHTGMSEVDGERFRQMIRKIDAGEEEASCIVQTVYDGKPLWISSHFRAVRNEDGRLLRAEGYATNVSEQKRTEDRITENRRRMLYLEGNMTEVFSCNITRNNQVVFKTRDEQFKDTEPGAEILAEAEAYFADRPEAAASESRKLLLHMLARIPYAEDRKLFLGTCLKAVRFRRSTEKPIYRQQLRYRRLVGDAVVWVNTDVEVLTDPSSGDTIAFFYTRDINDTVISEMIAHEIAAANYTTVMTVELRTGRLSVRASDDKRISHIRGVSYERALHYAESFIFDRTCAREISARFALDAITEGLKNSPVLAIYYTAQSRNRSIAGNPHRRNKVDCFYLDHHKDTLVFLQSEITEIYEEERENRERMAEALAEANQASMAKSSFLSRMSHEIRTPLNAIIGMDTIAAQSIGNEDKVADCISKIGLSSRYLLSLINDILDMSRIESGKMLLKNETFQFKDFIDGINTIIYNQAKAKGIDYECIVAPDIADSCIGDEMKLQQILINVLGNAVKFTEKGKVALSVRTVSRQKNGMKLRFTVSDTGIGISEENQKRIFEPFEQADASTTTVFGGTGLGLAITKNLVNLMGGWISLRSIVGVGSEFTIDIPLETAAAAYPVERPVQLRNLHVLVVDDDMIICEQTEGILKEIGMCGEWVTSGREAVDRVRQNWAEKHAYDYILINWKMPEMDGVETTREIRKIVGPEVTIIIISAYDWQAIEEDAKAAGADYLITKPFFRSTLISAFEKSREKPGKAAGQEMQYDFTGKRLLVAEDNALNAEIAETLLKEKGFAVETAANGLKAFEMFTKHPQDYYDAVLMDIRMPLMDGLQAAMSIRHWDRADAKTIPIIAMTANAFDEDVEKSRAAGMNAHLSKPIEPEVMYDTLNRLLLSRNI